MERIWRFLEGYAGSGLRYLHHWLLGYSGRLHSLKATTNKMPVAVLLVREREALALRRFTSEDTDQGTTRFMGIASRAARTGPRIPSEVF